MEAKRHIWQSWSDNLHRWGLSGLAASFLEAGGPITFIIAQLAYVGQPLLFRGISSEEWQAFTQLLEDADEMRTFVSLIREGELN
jgi:hypothetical protein